MANTIGTRLCTLRKQRNLTQDQLAEAMGVSAQAVSKWENDLSCPDIAMLPNLADYFQVSIDSLLRDESHLETPKVVPPENRKPFEKLLLKIQVRDDDGTRVNVNLPLSLIKLGLEMGLEAGMLGQVNGKTDVLKKVDFTALLQLADAGAIGKLVEVDDGDGCLVDIYIE